MKFIVISDMHGAVPEKLKETIEKEKPVAILCSGDSVPHTWMGDEGEMEKSIESLIETQLPVIYCSGNMDDVLYLAMLDELAENFHLIDQERFDLEDFRFIGLGEFTNPVDEKTLEMMVDDHKNLIILNHRPPEGTKVTEEDNWWGGEDPKIFRQAIETHKPIFVLCGHIHEKTGTDKIGDSLIINSATRMGIVEIKNGNAVYREVEDLSKNIS